MSGPQRRLSSLIQSIAGRNAEIQNAIDRLRAANRRLTGSDGRPPPPLRDAVGQQVGGVNLAEQATIDAPPLMVVLTITLDAQESLVIELNSEVGYMEQHSETGNGPAEVTAAGVSFTDSKPRY